MKKYLIIIVAVGLALISVYAIKNFTQNNGFQTELEQKKVGASKENRGEQLHKHNEKSKVSLKFIDSQTGFSIDQAVVEIIDLQNQERVSNNKLDSTKEGSLVYDLPAGRYEIRVNAENYKPMETQVKVNDSPLNLTFNLDPEVEEVQLSSKHIQSLHRHDAMVIVGTVIDSETNQPLKGVKIHSRDNIVKTSSDKEGFFQIVIPLPSNEMQVNDRANLLLELANYKNKVLTNFDMWSNGDLIVTVEMTKGSGTEEEKVIKGREAKISFKSNQK